MGVAGIAHIPVSVPLEETGQMSKKSVYLFCFVFLLRMVIHSTILVRVWIASFGKWLLIFGIGKKKVSRAENIC